MKSKVSPIDAHLGYWLRMLSNQVSQSFARKVESRGVTVAEWVVLRSLFEREDVQAVELAKSTGLTKGAISKLIARLENKNLISRVSSETDARSEELNMTPRGRKLVPQLAKLADENDKEFFSSLTAGEAQDLLAMIKKVLVDNRITAPPLE